MRVLSDLYQTRHKRRTPLPGYQNCVIRSVNLGMPSAPALIKAWRNKASHHTFQFWTSKERYVHPVRVFPEEGKQYTCG